MRTLTGKCKDDFGIWHFERNTPIEEYKNYPALSETCQNALIIEFFDSVGIYVNVLRYENNWKMIVAFQFRYNFRTRQEAINKSIIKANELYNSKQ